jgi:deoxyribodipyrimidine photo-lyase
MKEKTTFFWFRRDLRLNDNTALIAALKASKNVQCIFIYDRTILDDLPKDDARVNFIWTELSKINLQLNEYGSSLLVKHGSPIEVWNAILSENSIESVYINRDYEPKAIERDEAVRFLLKRNGIPLFDYKDHVFFEKNEILKADGTPYTVYTPYKNKWLEKFKQANLEIPVKDEALNKHFVQSNYKQLLLADIGFSPSKISIPPYSLKGVDNYDQHRNFPSLNKTTMVGHHLRFGTISIRSLIYYAKSKNATYLAELIWRDFFSQILFHFPNVVDAPFKSKYADIKWRNNEKEFQLWCEGKTGYPIVDAGMRQLNQTGFMHNRVRMITASFLIKHLLIDWRWGEAYFAEKLLDFDLASNNGNWQWAAGTGCDAAPYFRVFNPTLQQEKFDKDKAYIKHWIPNFTENTYLEPIVDHKMARERAIATYKDCLNQF